MSWLGGRNVTNGDIKFLRELGIEPSSLDDPSPSSLPPPLPPEALIHKLMEKDACWLQNLGVMWEQEPEPDFIPPKSLREYLARYPNGITEAVRKAARRLGLGLSDDDLDDLAQDIVLMFLDFSTDLEDIFEMYPLHPPMRPGGCRSQHFHHYLKLRVRAAMLTLLRDRVPRPGDFR
jgi:hypothetical protein